MNGETDMEYKEILEEARKQTAPHCMACPVCNGKACGNNVPGPGSKAPGNAAARNYDKWQEIFVNMDTLCQSVPDPDVSFELFGHRFSAPIFVAPLGAVDMHYGPKYNDQSYNVDMMKGAIASGILAFTGDGVNAQIMKDAIADSAALGGLSIPTPRGSPSCRSRAARPAARPWRRCARLSNMRLGPSLSRAL